MALDLPAIVQPNMQQPDIGHTMLEAQQVNAGALSAQRQAALPGALSAYNDGDKGAIAQIAMANPEAAKSLLDMSSQEQTAKYQTGMLGVDQQRANQEGAQAGVLMAGEKQDQKIKAIDLQRAQQDQALQRTQMQGLAAQNALSTVSDMRKAGADPSQIQKVVKNLHDQYGDISGEKAHPELADYQGDPDTWMQNMTTITQHGQMAGNIRAQMNMTPEQREFQNFKNMSPEDRQNYLAMQSKNPYMLKTPAPDGAGNPAPAAPPNDPAGLQSNDQMSPYMQAKLRAGQQPNAPAPIKNGAVDESVDLSPQSLDVINSYQGDARIKTMAKNMLLAQQPPPTLTSRTPPDVKEAFELAQQADSTFSTMAYPTKLKITNAFMDGPEAKNVNAINTVIHHLGRMADNDKNLSSSGSDLLNAVYNDVAPHLSDSAKANLNSYKIDQTAVGSEAAKAYKGAGSLSEGEQKEWGDKLNVNNGPEARADARKEVATLAMGKIEALQDQWKQAYPNSTRSFFTPKAIEALKKLGVDTSDIQLPGGAPGQATGSAPAGKKPPAGGVLHVDKNGNKAMVFPDGSYKEVP